MIDVAVMVGNTWRHVGSPPLALEPPLCMSLLPSSESLVDYPESLYHVFNVSVGVSTFAELRVVSFNQTLSSLPSCPDRSGFRPS